MINKKTFLRNTAPLRIICTEQAKKIIRGLDIDNKEKDYCVVYLHNILKKGLETFGTLTTGTPIDTTILRNHIPHKQIPIIRNILKESGIIEVNENCIPGLSCYKHYYILEDKKIIFVRLLDDTYREKMKNRKMEKSLENLSKIPKAYGKIVSSLYNNIIIDDEGMLNEIENMDVSDELKSVYKLQVDNILKRVPIVDDYGRLHNGFVNLKSSLRKYIKIDNGGLFMLDIVNSQPFFFLLVIIDDLVNKMDKDELESFNNFKTSILEGTLYEDLANVMNVDISEISDRKNFKQRFYKELMYANTYVEKYQIPQTFQLLYPELYFLLNKEGYLFNKENKLAHRLQKMESDIVFGFIADVLSEEKRGILTIHDAICVGDKNFRDQLTIKFIEYIYSIYKIFPVINSSDIEK